MQTRNPGKQLLAWMFSGALLLAGCASQQAAEKPAEFVNPRPGQPGHRAHEEWQGQYPSLESLRAFKVTRTIAPPAGFLGNLAYDPAGRLFLVSMGPPTNPSGPSMLYQLDPDSGKVTAQAKMPFQGDLASPVYIDGYLYQGVYHESKMYKVSVGARDFGAVVKTIPLPTLNDLKLADESHPVPFIEFGGVAVTPDKNIIFHADDVGELITIDRETGSILNRVRTLKALGGIASAKAPDGRFLVLGNSDPRGSYCALSYPPTVSRSAQQKDISWAVLDGQTGEVLASLRKQNSPAYASTIALVRHEAVDGAPYGKFVFLATGEEGILTMEWTPAKDSY
ncbi:MAG TPA: hypothetical protein VND93_14940 [Myxococcales bacterium]|nr:hypothetical protein [Myxococcales bacterium]